MKPDLSLEFQFEGPVCGVDEVGRGPLAGPVVAAAVILPDSFDISGLNDSKKLSAKRREALNTLILREATWRIEEVGIQTIEEINILNAALLAMKRAVEGLEIPPKMALIDGNKLPQGLACPAQAVVKGDSVSASIAAASIIAKVYRDNLMADLAREYPGYGWERNAGYGTKEHQEAYLKLGPTPHHRKLFTAKLEEKRIVA